MWMASDGITSRSRSRCTSRVSTPSSVRSSTRPATVSGRSSQVAMFMPPYPSTLRRRQPSASTVSVLTFHPGASLWLAVMRQPPMAWSGMRQATTADPPRIR